MGEHIWSVSAPERGRHDAPCWATKVVWMGFGAEPGLLISKVAIISQPQEIQLVAAHSLEHRCQLKACLRHVVPFTLGRKAAFNSTGLSRTVLTLSALEDRKQ